jgi:hypothetical protein
VKQLIAIAWIVAILGHSAEARSTEWRGGIGIQTESGIQLLDLVESGARGMPGFRKPENVNPRVLVRVSEALRGVRAPSEWVAEKLTELLSIDPGLAWSILRTLELFQWAFAREPLPAPSDEGSFLRIAPEKWVRLADRQEGVILLAPEYWEQLEAFQQAALILHEALYALIVPSLFPGIGSAEQSVQAVREINGYLFRPELLQRGLIGLERVVRYRYPPLDAREWGTDKFRIEERVILYNGGVSLESEPMFSVPGASFFSEWKPVSAEALGRLCSDVAENGLTAITLKFGGLGAEVILGRFVSPAGETRVFSRWVHRDWQTYYNELVPIGEGSTVDRKAACKRALQERSPAMQRWLDSFVRV